MELKYNFTTSDFVVVLLEGKLALQTAKPDGHIVNPIGFCSK
jgi:hypothetical protein